MEAISSYFAANPAVVTLLAIFLFLFILYTILKKFIKFAVVLIFVVLLVGGIYLFKDPASMPEKIRTGVETLKAGGEQIGDKFSNFWQDTKELFNKGKKVPGDINRMLDVSRETVGK
ncbi:MAG: hypothetical protein R6W75_09295 [Smithellaceae bacterium]